MKKEIKEKIMELLEKEIEDREQRYFTAHQILKLFVQELKEIFEKMEQRIPITLCELQLDKKIY